MKRILVADDNQTFLMYLGLLLKRLDFKVMPAESGLEVLRLLKLSKIDLVMLDVHMKAMDGITALRFIKEDPQTADVPVVMISHDTDSEMVKKCRDLGCFDYLAKPLKIDLLHESLQRCFFERNGRNRRFLRAPFKGKVFLSHNGNEYPLYAETLSEGGMYVVKEDPLPAGSEVVVKCGLGKAVQIVTNGRVIYTKRLFGEFMTLPPGMAIEFEGLSEEDAGVLKFFIEDLMAGEIFDSQDNGFFER